MLKECFKVNRKRMLDLMEDNSILLAFSRQKEESITNERYNVNRNYFYLSGVLEFDNVVLLTKINSKTQEIIYINPYDELKAKWVGAPFSKEKVTELSSIQDVRYNLITPETITSWNYISNFWLQILPIVIIIILFYTLN